MYKTIVNILPTTDLREHFGDDKCSCRPLVRIQGEKMIVIHKNYDLKESPVLKFYELSLRAGQLN